VLPGVIGLVQATEAIKLLLGVGEPLIGRLLTYDALGMRFREVKLRRDPKCPLCGEHPSITDLSIHRGDAAACAVNGSPATDGQPGAAAGAPAAKAGG
jgi:sulfur-carrier protein adenylyltransferase/sulfurtransferase